MDLAGWPGGLGREEAENTFQILIKFLFVVCSLQSVPQCVCLSSPPTSRVSPLLYLFLFLSLSPSFRLPCVSSDFPSF